MSEASSKSKVSSRTAFRPTTLEDHLKGVADGSRKFENAYKAVSRMILDGEDRIEPVSVNGKDMLDYKFFRDSKKPVIGMYEEINDLVNFIQDGAEGGPSKEQAFVLIGQPGNGKTFIIDYLRNAYLDFLSEPENMRYTFRFKGLDDIEGYNGINIAESETFEDPMVLAMNMFEDEDDALGYLSENGFDESLITDVTSEIIDEKRFLSASSEYMLRDLQEKTGKDLKDVVRDHIDVIPVIPSHTTGNLTGKYAAQDKITASAKDLVGSEDMNRLLRLEGDNPFKFNLRKGALARCAGGGIHFSDEIFKNKEDLLNVYLNVIQNKEINIGGSKWPMDVLILATSNNEEYNEKVLEEAEAPLVDRFSPCFVAHNTDYKLQSRLTDAAIGRVKQNTVKGEELHFDPNVNYVLSTGAVLTRLPEHNALPNRMEMMKLAAGEVVKEKSVSKLSEIVDELSKDPDVNKHFGHQGLGQRDLIRAVRRLKSMPETIDTATAFAYDAIKALDWVKNRSINDPKMRAKIDEDLDYAKELYKEKINTDVFNAYMEDSDAVRKDVMRYVNMVVGLNSPKLGSDKIWKYRDPPRTGKMRQLKIDETHINAVEENLGLTTDEESKAHRSTIRDIYAQKINEDPNYDFMDNSDLVKAVTEVRLHSDIGAAGSLVGALNNRSENEENMKVYNRVMEAMVGQLGYNKVSAEKTIEYFCDPDKVF